MLSGTVTVRSNQTWNIWQSWARNEQWKFNVLEFSFEHINQCGKKTENEKRNWRKSAIPKDFSIGLVRWLQVSSELPSACIYSHRHWKMVFLQATVSNFPWKRLACRVIDPCLTFRVTLCIYAAICTFNKLSYETHTLLAFCLRIIHSGVCAGGGGGYAQYCDVIL